MSTKCIGVVLALCLTTGAMGRADEPTGLFPVIEGWKMSLGSTVYTPDNLWDIIDGAAEVFLSYGFVDLHIAEYENATGTDVRVELYRHTSRENAFGIYAQERKPGYHFISVGTQGYIEENVLNFLCGKFYVKISSHRRGKEGLDAMALLARKVEDHLQQGRTWPSPLTLFPSEGKIENGETYIAENFLGYRFFHSAFVAEYTIDPPLRMFVIECDSAAECMKMAETYLRTVNYPGGLVEGSVFAVTDPHHGELLLLVQGRHLAGVVGRRGGGEAEKRLQALKASLPGRGL